MQENRNVLKVRAEVPEEKISDLVVLLAVALTKNYPGIGPEFINALAKKINKTEGATIVFNEFRPYFFGWEKSDNGYLLTVKALTKQEATSLLRTNPEIAGGVPKKKVRSILEKCEESTDQKQAERYIEDMKSLLHTFFINNRIKDELL